VAVDYPRAMAAYKVAAEGGHALCQWEVGTMYYNGRGVDVDYAQARAWIENAAAQDDPEAVGQLGTMYGEGKGVTTSFRRAREYYERAIELGNSLAVDDMQNLTQAIQQTLMDKRVEIHGTSRADMNGKRGVATDFHPMGGSEGDRTTWRYTVKLDGGEEFKLKRENVRAEGLGPEKLFELGYQVWTKLSKAARIGGEGDGARWRELSASEQGEMDGAIVMLQEAMNLVSEGGHVHSSSQCR